MPKLNTIEDSDYLQYYEIDFSNDDWVGQAEMNKLHSLLCCYLNEQLQLEDIENGICYKILQSNTLKIKIFNDSACYWLDVMVIDCDHEFTMALENTFISWIAQTTNHNVV